MSFEDTNCPCGERKDPHTLLCEQCQEEFKQRPELKDYANDQLGMQRRRDAAIILVTLARGRTAKGRYLQYEGKKRKTKKAGCVNTRPFKQPVERQAIDTRKR